MENTKKYLAHWNNFFVDWKKNPKATFDKDEIWSKHKGKEWETDKGEKRSTKLEPDVFPQPYLGDIHDHSVITLNLNPSRSKKYGYENFKEPDLNSNFKYKKYAKSFPTYDTHSFWQNQDDWIDRIFIELGKEKPSEKDIKPFAIEICPWGSKSFQKLKIDDPLINYMNQYVFEVIEKVIDNSKLKIVLSVGKAYYDIFDNKKSDFKRLEVISYKGKKPEGIDWPQTIDEKSGKDRDVQRTFTIWKKGKILYLNTYASGSNTPPAAHFDGIQNGLIRKHLIN